jgi:NO-binding membrane sensor protein with MHYT domain
MGGIAIWGMHFIGNRAIVLGDGSDELQLAYSSGFTALSFIIPILVLLIAFLVVGETDEKLDTVRVILGGTLTGLGVCGMHYLGQAGISNYDCIYTVVYTVGATIIAVVVSIVALGAFTYFRFSWDIRWWCRALCAAILAAAVSGMHWVASLGTEYQRKHVEPGSTNNFSRNNTFIGVIALVVLPMPITSMSDGRSLFLVVLSSSSLQYLAKDA